MTLMQDCNNVLKNDYEAMNKELDWRYIIWHHSKKHSLYYAGEKCGEPIFSYNPSIAKVFMDKRHAEAVADFIDPDYPDRWKVVNMRPCRLANYPELTKQYEAVINGKPPVDRMD